MLELLSGTTDQHTPGTVTGRYVAQPTITTGDYNFSGAGSSTVRVGDFLYIAPGYVSTGSGFSLSNSFFRYNLKTFKLESLNPIPKSVWGASIWYYNNKIYLVGGLPANGVTNSYLCIYDTTTRGWTNTAAVNILRQSMRVFIYSDRLYLIGGMSAAGGSYYDVISYSLVDYSFINHGNFLNTLGASPLDKPSHGILLGEKFFFSPGKGAGNSWMMFDVINKNLRILKSNPTPIIGECPVLLGDKIAIRNGRTSISIYDVLTDTWDVVSAETNTSSAQNVESAHFEYDGSIWTKFLNSNDVTIRRFWRIN